MEIWKDVVGYEGLYRVSSLGNVYSFGQAGRQPRMLKTKTMQIGYKMVGLHINRKGKKCYVHRLMAIAFLPNPNNKREVNHIDGIKTNNVLSNLEWATSSENRQHAYNIGLRVASRAKGAEHKNSKIVLDKSAGIFYECVKDAADAIGMKYKTLANMLCGHRRNKTSMVYV